LADDKSLTIPMITLEAVDNVNNHDHEHGLGVPIGAGGIKAKAVTEEKLDDSSVSTRTIQPDSVLLSSLHPDVRSAIAAGGNEGVPGLTNFIAEGLGITAGSGLTAAVQSGRASITEKTVKLTTAQNITMGARMASLLYAQKQADSDVPLIGKINSISPLATIDNNTITMWIFNQTTAGSAIPNSAVGVSGIAVANNLVASGGLASVDGRIDHAIKGDGTSGYYVSQNLTGFPTGANTVGLVAMFTVKTVPTVITFIASYGHSTTNTGFGVYVGANGNIFIYTNATDIDTGYAVTASTDYLLELNYNGSVFTVYNYGTLVYTSGVITLNIGTTYNFTVLRHSQVASYYSNFTIHYIEIRNALRSSQQIADNAVKLLFPCRYTGTLASYPVVAAGETAYHEYKFAEASGTTVGDSAGTLSGTATGTTIVDSEIGLGKARKFNADGDKIACGNFDWSGLSEWTIIFSCNTASVSSARPLLSNRITVGAPGTSGTCAILLPDGTVSLDTSVVQRVTSPLPVATNVFCCLTYKDGICYAYENALTISKATAVTMRAGANPFYIGFDPGYTNTSYRGLMEYLLFIPRLLSPAEVAPYYNALKNTAIKDMRSILPSDAISLGTIQTDSTKVIGYNTDYKTGRREGAVRGNRKVFLGFKYFSGNAVLNWENPFGTRKVKTYYTWAQDANGTNESEVNARFNAAPQYYGLQSRWGSAGRISAETMTNGVAVFNNVFQASGYIGCYAELLEDD